MSVLVSNPCLNPPVVVCSDANLFVVVNMAGEVVVDALPYIDQGYDEPGVREAVGTILN